MGGGVDWTEILFIAAGIVGALVLAWMGHLHVRLPRGMSRRLEHAEEWVETPPSAPTGTREGVLRAARDHALDGASLGAELLQRVSGDDEEVTDFLEHYREGCEDLAGEAAEILERRYVTGELGPAPRGDASPMEPLP